MQFITLVVNHIAFVLDRYPGCLHGLQGEFGREHTQLSRVLNEVFD